jgi:Fe-S cluster biogenesis protein NfuA/nitrite reductase/ring-hydroxylating ferredoxin subunit
MDDAAVRERVTHVEALLERLDGVGDPEVADLVTAVVQALLDLHGEGLRRLLAQMGGDAARDAAADELVAHLMVLHGVHPVPLDERVRAALDDVAPYLESHGGGVELMGIEDGVVRLRLRGSCDGCPSSAATLKLAIEDAIEKAAPDVDRIEAEGAAAAPQPALLQLEVSPALRRTWAAAGEMDDVNGGGPVIKEIEGQAMLFVRLDQKLYAYRPACPGCGRTLGDGPLEGRHLRCAACGHVYDLRRAGRCEDARELHLDPVPLLRDGDGGYRVALT